MYIIVRLALMLLLLANAAEPVSAQKKKKRKQFIPPHPKVEVFRNWRLSDSLFMHYYVPKKSITAYSNEGQKITLSPNDTIFSVSIDTGMVCGITGNWAKDEKNINLTYYIPFDSNLTDVTEIKSIAIRKEYYGQVSERILLAGGLLLPFLLLGLYVWRAAPERVAFPWKKI